MLSTQSRELLLRIARQAVESVVRGRPMPEWQIDAPELSARQGAFVTLRTGGELRGCIGRFVPDAPLWQVVGEMAVAAAQEDPRFFGRRLKADELERLRIEVSVLSPLERISDPLGEIELGRHGVYIRRGGMSGCFLPQVATETGWTKEEFLSNCCAGKAGLAADAWREPDAEVFVFTAEIIEEP
jgi:AmmeMemoRadiSam system protein A